MIISVDSGNQNNKTENFVYPSSLTVSNVELGMETDVLEYEGKYYTTAGKRISYMRDKTSDQRFFILTLFGIAKELEKKAKEGLLSVKESNTYTVTLLNGLPPKHIKQAEKFKKYFMEKDEVSFKYNHVNYTIKIKNSIIFPQTYAAAMTVRKQLANEEELLVVDIGGFTLDYILLNNGKLNMDKCESLENGIIKLYNTIIDYANSEFNVLLNEQKVDALLNGTSKIRVPGLMEYAQDQAARFVTDFVDALRERGNDLITTPVIFVGGGSLTLKKYIEENPLISNSSFIDNVCANAIGYKIMYNMLERSKKASAKKVS